MPNTAEVNGISRAEVFELYGRAVIAVRIEVPFAEFLEEVLDSLGY